MKIKEVTAGIKLSKEYNSYQVSFTAELENNELPEIVAATLLSKAEREVEKYLKPNQTTKESMPKNETFGDDIPVPLICADCGKPINEKTRDYSIKHYGKTLCYDCQKKPENQK